MKNIKHGKNIAAFMLVVTMLAAPFAALGQTRVVAPKNKYKVQDDVKAGSDYAKQVEREMPILRDADSTAYIAEVGRKLAAAIPREFQQPAFQYSFKIVNARDINAFALPGGPMFVNRGMIEAAKNEGEMAGVMAHEISHVALRHSTAQMTKQSNPLNQILGIGAVIGDAILGVPIGQTVYASLLVLPFSREYETQADILGSQIMANAGYDPRDLANMFKTIEKQSGGSGPEFLSTHPAPANRYDNINKEASMLRVSQNPIKITRGFERIQAKLRSLPKAKSMSEIDAENKKNGGGTNNEGGTTQSPTANGRYESSVAAPSTRVRAERPANWLQLSVPNNWEALPESNSVWYAPRGAYGDQGITHGAFIGSFKPQNGGSLSQSTDEYVRGLLQGNDYLSQSGGYTRTTLSGRTALSTVLQGRSPVTNRTEVTTVYTTSLSDGQIFYVITVVPQNESGSYRSAFLSLLRSVRIND